MAPPNLKARIEEFVIKHWLPLIFAVAITFALAWPVPGRHVVHVVVLGNVHIVQEINMAIVFFLSGLALNTKDLKKAKGHTLGVVYGFIATLFITPCLGFAMREIPLKPKLFAVGLVIFCVVPTTLGIGVALVRSCKGNDGVALLMTVGTNMLGVVTMPLALKLLFLNFDLSGLSVKVDILNLFVKLLITILVPSVIGKTMREVWPAACQFATKHRTPLSMFSTANLAFIVWQTLSGARDLLLKSEAGMVVSVIVLAASIYLFYLAVNYVVIMTFFKMPTPEAISVIVMASQKSAPVAVTVISYITSNAAEQGLLAIPSIVGQLAQIFLGAAMAPAIARRADAYHAAIKQQAADIEQQQGGALQSHPGDPPESASSVSDANAAVTKLPGLDKVALEQASSS